MARTFDAIVIGSGLGGLTAGALCARAGKRVLVLERNDTFGGAATVYQHNGLAIESSLHEMDGFDAADPKLPLLRSLGLDRELQVIDVGDFYEVRSGLFGEPFVLRHGAEAALAGAISRFPQHKAGLEEYFRRLLALRDAASFAAVHQDDRMWWLTHAPEAVRKLWPLLRDGSATVGDVMRELFGDDEAVKIALGANLFYYHDDPDRMQFLRFAVAQGSFIVGGGHYIRGGSQALTDRLVAVIAKAGGVLETGRTADEIVVADGRVAGVVHHASDGSGRIIDHAQMVFGNSAPQVLAAMLPADMRSAFLAPYARFRASISLWTVSLGLSRPARDFGVRAYSTFIMPGWQRAFAQMREAADVIAARTGTRMPPYVLVDYRQIDSGLNEIGPGLVTLCGADRIENWSGLGADERKARKAAWIDALVTDLDRHFPGLSGSIVHREMATAETMQHYLNTPGGSVYGFAPEGTVGQTFRRGDRAPRSADSGSPRLTPLAVVSPAR